MSADSLPLSLMLPCAHIHVPLLVLTYAMTHGDVTTYTHTTAPPPPHPPHPTPVVMCMHSCSHRPCVFTCAGIGDESGHGSHTCGLVLGARLPSCSNSSRSNSSSSSYRNSSSSSSSISNSSSSNCSSSISNSQPTYDVDVATGIAPGARLAFFDIWNGSTANLVTPDDLDADYYGVQYGMGARVQSDSWGYKGWVWGGSRCVCVCVCRGGGEKI